jgi:hypothetical protein
MSTKPSRAWVCVEATNKQIDKRLSGLLMKTISAHFQPFFEEQAKVEEQIYLKAQAALTVTDGEWKRVLSFNRPLAFTSVRLVPSQNSSSFSGDEAFVFEHPAIREPFGEVKVAADGFIYYDGKWREVEEIHNISDLYFTAHGKLEDWLNQFKTDNTWDEAALSRVCAVSPAYRACLVNKGRRWPETPPAKITVFKHGPRGLDFKPMEPILARALQVASNLPEVAD